MNELFGFKELVIGDLVIRVPIIQGGMGIGVSLAGLASAVANEGGVGVIATAGIGMAEPDFASDFVAANIRAFRKEIQKAKELTNGILGVNIMMAITNFSDMVKIAIQEKIDIIFSGAGLPLNLPSYLTEGVKTKLVPIVSSAKAAALIARRWFNLYRYAPDAFVVEGPRAGGHLGFKPQQIEDPDYQLEKLVPDVVALAKSLEDKHGKNIPVIAAGGIYDGADILKFIRMGASGVQMATRFVTTEECDASDAFKQSYIRSKKEDVVIIHSPVGLPGRAIRNRFIDDVNSGKKKPYRCDYHCILTCDFKNCPYCIAAALVNAKMGRFDDGFAFCGANVYRADKIVSVKSLMDDLKSEYVAASKSAAASLDSDSNTYTCLDHTCCTGG